MGRQATSFTSLVVNLVSKGNIYQELFKTLSPDIANGGGTETETDVQSLNTTDLSNGNSTGISVDPCATFLHNPRATFSWIFLKTCLPDIAHGGGSKTETESPSRCC